MSDWDKEASRIVLKIWKPPMHPKDTNRWVRIIAQALREAYEEGQKDEKKCKLHPNKLWVSLKHSEERCGDYEKTGYRKGLEKAAEIAENWTGIKSEFNAIAQAIRKEIK